MNNIVKEMTTDVLVIGGGAAGCLAALEASKVAENVMIVVKGVGGRSGNTPMAEGGIQGSFHISDSVEDHVRDTIDAGKYINNTELVEIMANKAPEYFKAIENYGVSFKKQEDDTYFQYTSSGSSFPRCLWINGGGAGLSKPLFKSVKSSEIEYKEDFMVTKLIVSEDIIVGALGIDYQNGEVVLIHSKAIVIATGGNESLYYFSDASVDSTGDGVALAYNAGAEVMNMEFVQFYPHSLVYPDALRGTIIPEEVYYDSLIKARIYNGLGEEFAHKYDSVRKERTTRDILARAIFTEIAEGRGTKHGGVIIDATGCDKKEIVNLVGPLYNFLLKNGVDMLKTTLEVAPSAHYQCGGICIDSKGSTNIKGLYAAGECTGGFDGANRLSSNALTEAVVFGIISGKNAGEYANEIEFLNIKDSQISEVSKDIFSIVENSCEEKIDVLELKVKLQKLMVEKVGVVREGNHLMETLETINDIKHDKFEKIVIKNKSLVYNQELIEALELKSLIDNALLVAKSALFRCESRGNHFRLEYPEENNKIWKKSSLISKEKNFTLI